MLSFASGTLAATGPLAFGGGTLQWYGANSDDISGHLAAIAAGQAAVFDTNGNNVTLSQPLAGSGGLTKLGVGTLILTDSNTYGGLTTISGGTLQVGNGDSSGTLGSGSVTDNAALVFDRSDDVTVGTVISGISTSGRHTVRRFLGMQLVDKSRSTLALRMDDRKQRVIVHADQTKVRPSMAGKSPMPQR